MNKIATKSLKTSRQTALNFICGIAEHLISMSIALFITPFLIGKLGLEAYGAYPAALEICAVFGIAFGIIGSTSSHYIAIEHERHNLTEASKYFSTAFFANIAASLILLTPMVLVSVFAPSILGVSAKYATDIRIFTALILAASAVDALGSAFDSVYHVTCRLDLRARQRLAGALSKALLLALLFGLLRPSVISVGASIFLCSAVGALISVLTAKKLCPELCLSVSLFSKKAIRHLSSSGLWFSLNRIASVLMRGAAVVVVNIFLLPEASGSYSVAFVFSNALASIILMLAAITVPVSAKCFARGERIRLRDSLIRDQRMLGCFSAVAVSVATAFCTDFFKLWVGEESRGLTAVAVILLAALPALACATPIINVATVMNRTRRMSFFFFGGGLLTLALILLLAAFTSVGTVGVALASSAAQMLWYAAAIPLFASRVFDSSRKAFFSPISSTYLSYALSVVCCLLLKYVCDIKSWLGLVIVCLASAVIASAVSFAAIFKLGGKQG